MTTSKGVRPYYWDVDEFIVKAQELHGDRWNYDYLKGKKMTGSRTLVDIICNACQRVSTVNATDHITGKGTCKWCKSGAKTHREVWSLEHLQHCMEDEKYANFQLVSADEPVKYHAKICVACRTCATTMVVTMRYFLTHPSCKHCTRMEEWTMQRFLDAAYDIHGDKYDYTAVRAVTEWSCTTHVPMTCRTCFHTWQPLLTNHISHKRGCPNYRSHPKS